jgi:hypothetical protein
MNSEKTKFGTPGVPELDLRGLLGFERVDAEQAETIGLEDAAAVACNKRGEGPPKAK